MAIMVVEFSHGGAKLEIFLPNNQHIQKKLLNFRNWVNGPIWVNFYVKNYGNLSQFFSLKNTNLEAHFLLLTFFDEINF